MHLRFPAILLALVMENISKGCDESDEVASSMTFAISPHPLLSQVDQPGENSYDKIRGLQSSIAGL